MRIVMLLKSFFGCDVDIWNAYPTKTPMIICTKKIILERGIMENKGDE